MDSETMDPGTQTYKKLNNMITIKLFLTELMLNNRNIR